jgi:hypothetical protein
MLYWNAFHQVLGQMLCTSELDMADSVSPDDVDIFLDNAAWAICSTYHTVLKASPGTAIFGRDLLFNIPFVADWYKIGEHRQSQTDCNNERKNKWRIDYDYKIGDQRNKIGKNKHPESNTLYKGCNPRIGKHKLVATTAKGIILFCIVHHKLLWLLFFCISYHDALTRIIASDKYD